ncbi:MAG: helical backbone metal receptor [Oscillospiraceae bacterium]
MPKKLFMSLLCLTILFSLCACGEKGLVETVKQSFEYPYEVTISTLEASVLEKPERVVSLSPSLTEIAFSLGVGDRLVGVSDFCDYPEQTEALQHIGTIQNPNLAAIKELNPQIVLCSASPIESDLIALQQMGALVVIIPRATNLDGVYPIYDAVGCIFNGKSEGLKTASAIYTPYKEKLNAINAAVQGKTPPNAVYLTENLITMATGDTFESNLLTFLGISNLAASNTDWTYPKDKLSELKPEVILYDASNIKPKDLAEADGYKDSTAIKDNAVYEINSTAVARQGIRMFKELLNISDLVNPGIVPVKTPTETKK